MTGTDAPLDIVVAYRGIPHGRGWAAGDSLVRGFRRLGHRVVAYGNFHGTPERLEGGPALPASADLVVYCECNDVDPQYLELRDLPARARAYWDFDVHNHPGRTLQFVREMGFSHVFFGNRYFHRAFRSTCERVCFLPLAYDDELYAAVPGGSAAPTVGFCGTPYRQRRRLVERLGREGIDVEVAWGRFGADYVRTVKDFGMHLNFHPGGGRGLLVGRVWETLGAGTLLLTEREDFVELFFRDMEEVVLFSSVDELVDRVRLLRDDGDTLRRIAAAGHRRALAEHSFLRRAEQILAFALRGETPPWSQEPAEPPAATRLYVGASGLAARAERRLPGAFGALRRVVRTVRSLS